MINRYKRLLLPVFLAVCILPSYATAAGDLTGILAAELDREMAVLAIEETSPYYMALSVSDVHRTTVSASFGSLTSSESADLRYLSADVRVGGYDLDNTHELRDQYSYSSGGRVLVARDDNRDAIASSIWQETNRCYREALDRWAKVKTNVAIKVAEEDSSADFSREKAISVYSEPPLDVQKLLGDVSRWEAKMKTYSAPFLADADIYGGTAAFSFTVERKHVVTTEGARLTQNLVYARIMVTGFIKSDDGMELPLYKTYFAYTPDELPADDVILADVRAMMATLHSLRNAPVVEPYTGPAILSGRSAAVFFHEILGHRIEGHRQKSENEGQTFKKFVGQEILPADLSIVFDPTRSEYHGTSLMGKYAYDDEGIAARPVTIVDHGVLEGFLMSRSPIENFPNSNGHGRAQAGYQPVARQSNMIVESSDPVSDDVLRERLIELCKNQGKPFGLYFKDIQGGFTFTGRSIPNVFNLMPVEVYRVFTDGRPDELVRGVDLVGTPLVMFSMISAAGASSEIFNGICGAESGSVPVSAISPPLLVMQIEVQKQQKSQDRPPLLPRPDRETSM